jgi:hypothetical protein
MVKKLSFVLCFLAGFNAVYSLPPQGEESKLKILLEEFRKAMQDPDEKKLNELLSSQLTYGHSNGMLDTKESLISNYVSGKANFDDLEFSEISIIENASTAIIRHSLKAKSLDAGKEPSVVFLKVMLVWTKEKGNWKLLARQAVKA